MKEQLCVLVLSRWDLNHNTAWQGLRQHVTGLSYPTRLAALKAIYISATSIGVFNAMLSSLRHMKKGVTTIHFSSCYISAS